MSLPAGVTNPELARRGQSWEMAQRVKCLVHMSKDLSSDPLITHVSAGEHGGLSVIQELVGQRRDPRASMCLRLAEGLISRCRWETCLKR